MKPTIEVCSFERLRRHKDWDALVREYIAETALDSMGAPSVQDEQYREADRAGELRCLVVLDGDRLAGLLVLTVSKHRHYTRPLMAVDSIYLRRPWRKGRIGLDLIGAARALAAREGAQGLVLTAIPGSPLDRLAPKIGMVLTHHAYWFPTFEG